MTLPCAAPRGILRPFVEMGRPLLPLLRQLHARGVAPTLLPAILERLPEAGKPTPPPALDRLQPLPNRELDVLELLAQRLTNKEIAERLVVAPNTIRTHLTNLFEKLGAEGRRDAVVKARAYGIIP